MLNRMVELADQSANGTYEGATDRANLQKEVDQLKERDQPHCRLRQLQRNQPSGRLHGGREGPGYLHHYL